MEPVHQAAAVGITVLLPGRASPFRCHWTENFVSQTFPTSHWTSVFDRAQEGRPLRLEKKKRKEKKKKLLQK